MVIDIGRRREFVWDDFLIDASQTTAARRVHQPTRRETRIVLDRPWEGDGSTIFALSMTM